LKDLKFGIGAILIVIIIFTLMFQMRLTSMEQVAKDRYISTVVAIDFTRDKMKALTGRIDAIKAQEHIHHLDVMWRINQLDIRLVEKIGVNLSQMVNYAGQFGRKFKALDETIRNDIHYYSRDKWLENMSPEYREIFEKRGE